MKPEKLFPMFLKLSNRPCLVVGAGAIAESKIASLQDAGGHVRVVAPEATPQVRTWAQSKALDWHQRPFEPADLDGMFLVIAATSSMFPLSAISTTPPSCNAARSRSPSPPRDKAPPSPNASENSSKPSSAPNTNNGSPT